MSPRHFLVALLCLAWIVPGLVAHDPWKPDEAYTFGVVYDLLRGGSWLVPSLGGEPYLDEPPLYYWTAALAATWLSPPFALHDAARLATGFYMAIALVFCGLAGRELNGRGQGTLAVLVCIGCFGLVVRGHQIITDVAALAGVAMTYYGFASAPRAARRGGWWTGTGIGVVFLSQGMLETAMLVAIGLVLVVCVPAWRTRASLAAAACAVLAAAPWLAIWPLALHAHSPDLFTAWLRADSLTRFLSGSHAGVYYIGILPWHAWPAWALALWALWRAGTDGIGRPAVALPVTGFVVSLAALSFSPEARELYALPLLLPLALLGVPAIASLRRGAANAWYWFSITGFTFFIVVAWFYWSALELAIPTRLHHHLHRIQPGYTPGFRWLPFAIGACYTAAWFAVLALVRRGPQRPAIVWATGVTVIWGLLAVLFIGWIDTGKSYRGMVGSMEKALPKRHDCVASRDLGASQRAMLHYFAGIVTRHDDGSRRSRECDLLIVQGRAAEERAPGPGWRKIWEGHRPGDKIERFRLYQRTGEYVRRK